MLCITFLICLYQTKWKVTSNAECGAMGPSYRLLCTGGPPVDLLSSWSVKIWKTTLFEDNDIYDTWSHSSVKMPMTRQVIMLRTAICCVYWCTVCWILLWIKHDYFIFNFILRKNITRSIYMVKLKFNCEVPEGLLTITFILPCKGQDNKI